MSQSDKLSSLSRSLLFAVKVKGYARRIRLNRPSRMPPVPNGRRHAGPIFRILELVQCRAPKLAAWHLITRRVGRAFGS